MGPADLHELKIMVERVVRPVRAKLERKMTMRQDLLSTLISAYEEEIAQGQDSKRALEYCTGLLGDPREATARLQQSVTWLESKNTGGDRYLLDLAVGRRCTSLASFRGIGLFVLMVEVSAFILFALVHTLLWLDGLVRFSEGLGTMVLVLTGFALYSLFFLCLLRFLADSLWTAFCRQPVPKWPHVVLVVVAAAFLLPSAYFGFRCVDTHGNLPATLHDTVRYFPAFAMIAPYALIMFVKVGKRLVHGPVDQEWRKWVTRDFAWVVPLLLIVFLAACILSHDLVVGLENALSILLFKVFWLTPFIVLLSHPKFVTAFRTCLEWEKLPLEQHMP